MIEVIPAVLPNSYTDIEEHVARVVDIAKMVQLDFCDGLFVKTKTWPFNQQEEDRYESILREEEGLPYWDHVNYEFDLMVKNASERFEEWKALGPTRVIFHLEAEDNLMKFFENLDRFWQEKIEFGIAIGTTTSPKDLEPYVKYISFVQCMGIREIGMQGQAFDERVLEQIQEVKKLYPELSVSVDGGVNNFTSVSLINSGADRLISGSYIFDSFDPQEAIKGLQNVS
jgi:ribulose-phosphate 3-epimerase